MTEETNIPDVPMLNGKPPRAYIKITLTTYMPADPMNPDAGGYEGEVQPMIFPVHEAGKRQQEHEIPTGIMSDLRTLFSGVVKHLRTYTPAPREPEALPTGDVLVTGASASDLSNNEVCLPESPANGNQTTPTGQEIEQGICARCGWRELECGCEDGYLSPEGADCPSYGEKA